MLAGASQQVSSSVGALFLFGLFGLLAFVMGSLLGIPAPLLWGGLFVIFLMGVLFLSRPKAYLFIMFLYYGLFSSFTSHRGGRVIPIYLPMENFFDEIFLMVPFAVLAMRWINRSLPRGAGWFFVGFILTSVLSIYVNKPPTIGAIRVVLAYMKFFLIWQFVRCLGPWTMRERKLLFWGMVWFALLQSPLNIGLWQRRLIASWGGDASVGSLGNAHAVGYISALALFMLVMWWLYPEPGRKPLVKLTVLGMIALIAHNLVFMTDTKHALLFMPFCGAVIFFSPAMRAGHRVWMIAGGIALAVAMVLYFIFGDLIRAFPRLEVVTESVLSLGKAETFRVLTQVFPFELPFFLVGAGPGNYISSVAMFSWRPLFVRYVLPFTPYAYTGYSAASTSVMGYPGSGWYTVWGEFGPVGLGLYVGLWVFFMKHLWRNAIQPGISPFIVGQNLALLAFAVLFVGINLLTEIFNIHIFYFTFAVLLGAFWDNPREEEDAAAVEEPQRKGAAISF